MQLEFKMVDFFIHQHQLHSIMSHHEKSDSRISFVWTLICQYVLTCYISSNWSLTTNRNARFTFLWLMYGILNSLARNSRLFRGLKRVSADVLWWMYKQVNYKTNHYIDMNYMVHRLSQFPAGFLLWFWSI